MSRYPTLITWLGIVFFLVFFSGLFILSDSIRRNRVQEAEHTLEALLPEISGNRENQQRILQKIYQDLPTLEALMYENPRGSIGFLWSRNPELVTLPGQTEPSGPRLQAPGLHQALISRPAMENGQATAVFRVILGRDLFFLFRTGFIALLLFAGLLICLYALLSLTRKEETWAPEEESDDQESDDQESDDQESDDQESDDQESDDHEPGDNTTPPGLPEDEAPEPGGALMAADPEPGGAPAPTDMEPPPPSREESADEEVPPPIDSDPDSDSEHGLGGETDAADQPPFSSPLSPDSALPEALDAELRKATLEDTSLSLCLIEMTNPETVEEGLSRFFSSLMEVFIYRDLLFHETTAACWVILPGQDLDAALSSCKEFLARGHAKLPDSDIRIGITSRNGRHIHHQVMMKEGRAALARALAGTDPLVGFQPDPEKYHKITPR
ncbi:hypothetical protein DC28_11215 [Spirochaeta lutea]|uniref:GGDEF domain-containing protein n=2 Tax=Spirochaeta lutea TaxID=1480694 RepID=A0A098QV05_9SPIO|nr:hypothetical protein DC28_11215 [Spirochaeta lutea]